MGALDFYSSGTDKFSYFGANWALNAALASIDERVLKQYGLDSIITLVIK